MTPHLKNWTQKYVTPRPRRMLACDGGGILGIMSLEILEQLERQLAKKTGEGTEFRLGSFFDYIAGTSTGAIIATGLTVGMTVQELKDFYVSAGPDMFEKAHLLARLRRLFEADPLRAKLRDILRDRELGASDLQALLLIVTRNATTDSPWPVCNNPWAKYNDVSRPDCNLQIPLWQLVRASTAAPVFFPPEIMEWEKGNPDKSFVFVDGGVTPYNNPAFLLYRMATAPEYRLNWPTGEDNMMLISVGTGSTAKVDEDLSESGNLITSNMAQLPGVLMRGAAIDQDINCRVIGRCVFGREIDREIGDMIPRTTDPESKDPSGEPIPLDQPLGRAFLYARYDPDVSAEGLASLGLSHIDPADVQAMDKIEHLTKMQEVGHAYAENYVDISPFNAFI